MNSVYVDSIGLAGPGLAGWRDARPVLSGETEYLPDPLPSYTAELLPANERRRITPTIRLALKVAEEAASASAMPRISACAVFASSGGDTELIDKICRALTLPERPVSPTQFHNSVHNAPAGYWSIATGSLMPSVTIDAHDASFVAGLLEAMAQVSVESVPVLMVAYDYPAPDPLARIAHNHPPFAVCLLLTPDRQPRSSVCLRIQTTRGQSLDRMQPNELERLRASNPAARSLPLLQAIAQHAGKRIVLPYLGEQQIAIDIETL